MFTLAEAEVETKHRLGKRRIKLPTSWKAATDEAGFIELPVVTSHAVSAGRFTIAHRDPWDRLIAAQALAEELVVVTLDPEMEGLGVRVLW